MKFLLPLLASLLLASCADSLEKVVDTNRQARFDRMNADLPLASGAADGMGGFIARKYDEAGAPSSKIQP